MNDHTAITERFVYALAYLKMNKQIRGFATFAQTHGMDKGNFHKLQRDPSRRLLRVEWLASLVTEYGISAEWLLTGNGNMIQKR